MGPTYAGLTPFLPPISQVSIDILEHIEVLCFPGSWQTHKIDLLVVGDLNSEALHIELLEGASGMDVLMASWPYKQNIPHSLLL